MLIQNILFVFLSMAHAESLPVPPYGQIIPCPEGMTYKYQGCSGSDLQIQGAANYLHGLTYFEKGKKNGDYIEPRYDGMRYISENGPPSVFGKFQNDVPSGTWVFRKSERYYAFYEDDGLKEVRREARGPDGKPKNITWQIEGVQPLKEIPLRPHLGYLTISEQPGDAPLVYYTDSSKEKIAAISIFDYTLLKKTVCDLCGEHIFDTTTHLLTVYEKKGDLCKAYLKSDNRKQFHEVWLACQKFESLAQYYERSMVGVEINVPLYHSAGGKIKSNNSKDPAYSEQIKVIGSKELNGELWLNIEYDNQPCSDEQKVNPLKSGWIPAFTKEGREVLTVYTRGC